MKKVNVASFDVDAQKGFTPLCPDELPVVGGDEIVEELNFLASKVGIRIGSKDAHPEQAVWIADESQPMGTKLDFPNADRSWNRHCVVGTKGFELLDGLPKPEEYDFFVWKGQEPDLHPYGACYHDIEERLESGVFGFLRDASVNTVIVSGLALDFCVSTTARQLRESGFNVALYTPGSRGIFEDKCAEAKEMLINMGVKILDSRDELDEYIESV
jgi:nicotinamidase/pyrazinamidase